MCIDCVKRSKQTITDCKKILANIQRKRERALNIFTKSFLVKQEKETLKVLEAAEEEYKDWLVAMN